MHFLWRRNRQGTGKDVRQELGADTLLLQLQVPEEPEAQERRQEGHVDEETRRPQEEIIGIPSIPSV